MSRLEFERGTPATITPVAQGDCVTVAIYRDSTARWEVSLYAHLPDGGARVLGRVVTCPRTLTGASETRVICSASLPGVDRWSASARCLGDAGSTPLGLEIVAARGMAEPRFVDLEYRQTIVLGGVDGVVQLAQGQRLASVAASAGAADATVAVGLDAPLPVLANRAIRAEYTNRRGVAVQFVGTASYLVEVEG